MKLLWAWIFLSRRQVEILATLVEREIEESGDDVNVSMHYQNELGEILSILEVLP